MTLPPPAPVVVVMPPPVVVPVGTVELPPDPPEAIGAPVVDPVGLPSEQLLVSAIAGNAIAASAPAALPSFLCVFGILTRVMA